MQSNSIVKRRAFDTRSTPYLRIALISAVCLIVLTALVAAHVSILGDAELLQLALSLRGEMLTTIIQLLTFVSSSIPAFLITLIVSVTEVRRAKRFNLYATWATLAFLGATACNIAIRVLVGRLPPQVEYIPNLLPELQADFQRFAFPSGHAMAALIAYCALLVLIWPHAKRRYLYLIFVSFIIIGVGFGRLYLGVHWPSDVMGGYLLGTCWLCIGLSVRSQVESKGTSHPDKNRTQMNTDGG